MLGTYRGDVGGRSLDVDHKKLRFLIGFHVLLGTIWRWLFGVVLAHLPTHLTKRMSNKNCKFGSEEKTNTQR